MMRVVLAIWLVVLGIPAAFAGESATFAAFGFSEDRRYFAYEELSIGDEGTPPYVTIKVVDLTTGALALGSPWTATSGEEGGKSISELRLEALEMGGVALGDANPGDPANPLALIGDGVRSTGGELTFALPQGADPDALSRDMRLDILLLPQIAADRCAPDYGPGAMGFAVMLLAGDESREIYRQDAEAGVETCLRRVRLYGVFQPYNGGDVETLVAVLSLYTVGFEGYDRHFMVIPLGAGQTP